MAKSTANRVRLIGHRLTTEKGNPIAGLRFTTRQHATTATAAKITLNLFNIITQKII